ncbi:MAG: flagellar type III secretion system pore protein FliP [Alphaproteobacteria bacterium]|nr:flagellar type III secretion system pore protein FliP [Alphaproteobacteria bacterium]
MLASRNLAGLLATIGFIAFAGSAAAQSLNLEFGDGGSATGRIVQIVVLMAILSLAPSILVMVTSFVRIVVVLSFLRTAMGAQQTPPNAVLISLALFMTFFIMQPTLENAYSNGIVPLIEEQISEEVAFERTVQPFRSFMLKHVREKDLKLFVQLGRLETVPSFEETPLRVLIPAFMISELRRAFEIGFLLFVPFLMIDMVVASVLMSMGMLMLPPVMISLPFKLIFFVLVDGWYLVAGSLTQSFGPL